jgi:parvulin-like peptidyl-prolyl isomerase
MRFVSSTMTCLALATLALPSTASPVLATNGQVSVTAEDFEAELLRIPKEQRFEFRASAQRIGKLVENILVNKALAAEARKQGLDKAVLAQREMELAAEKVLARLERERLEEAIQVPDLSKRARELYLANPGKYAIPASYHTQHILVDTRCRTRDAAMARAAEARKEIVAGLDFAEAVKRYSDDSVAARTQGDIGLLSADRLAPEYAAAAGKLKPGELSEPVQTQFGFHIIKLVAATPSKARRFEEVRDEITAELRQDYLRAKSEEITTRIRSDPAIKINVEAMDALKTQIPAPAAASMSR